MNKNILESLRFGARSWKLWILLVSLLVAVIIPHLLPRYPIHLLNLFLIGCLFALSYNILLGNTGLLSFGHGADPIFGENEMVLLHIKELDGEYIG